MGFGELKVGGVELPVVTLRLVHGGLQITATRKAPDPGLLHLPAGEVELVGEDGEQVTFAEPAYLHDGVSATNGGLLSVVVNVKLGVVGNPYRAKFSYELPR